MIKVMAGDKIDIFGKSYFFNTRPINNSNSTPLNLLSLMTNMLLSPMNAATGKGISAATLNTINTGQIPNSFFRGANGESTTIPKAYINYIFFDEQFKYAGGNASRVGTSGTVKDHWYADAAQLQNITVPKNGYIFVYVSNESNLDVFFDNLQVIHKPGPILEETHYYPFGLIQQGISFKTAGSLENKKQYNGIDHTTDLDLNQYDAFYRTLDPQIGRFWQIDPQVDLLESYSPYESMGNNPISNVDPMGDFKTRFGAWLHKVFNGGEVGRNNDGEYYVSKIGSSSSKEGSVTVTAKVTYGKGRDKLSAAREKLLDEINQQADEEQTKRNLTDAGLWDSNLNQDEANRNAAGLAFGTSIPTLLVRPIAITTSTNKVLPNSTPIIRSLGGASRAEMLARQLKMNINSATTRQVLNSLDETVETFISKFRKPSIRSEFPGEYLGKTVEEALKSSNTTVRKLLTSTRFLK